MKIVVCIKQVPDTRDVKLDPQTNTLKREGVESIVNPYDMHAVETALKIKDTFGGSVTALTMGPPQAADALKTVVEYGVDAVVLLTDRAFAGADTWATSYTLARGIRRMGEFDLVICGKQAIDGDTAQVGPGLAERLDIPCVSFVKGIREVNSEARHIIVERMMDDGTDVVKMPLPALITVVKEIGEVRVRSLKCMLKARELNVTRYGAADIQADPDSIGLNGSPTQVVEVFAPKPRGDRILIEGSPAEKAKALLAELKREKILSLGDQHEH